MVIRIELIFLVLQTRFLPTYHHLWRFQVTILALQIFSLTLSPDQLNLHSRHGKNRTLFYSFGDYIITLTHAYLRKIQVTILFKFYPSLSLANQHLSYQSIFHSGNSKNRTYSAEALVLQTSLTLLRQRISVCGSRKIRTLTSVTLTTVFKTDAIPFCHTSICTRDEIRTHTKQFLRLSPLPVGLLLHCTPFQIRTETTQGLNLMTLPIGLREHKLKFLADWARNIIMMHI